MILLAAYGKGERAAAAPAQRLSVQGPRRDRRRGGGRGVAAPSGRLCRGGRPRWSPAALEVSPWGAERRAARGGSARGGEDAPLALARQPRVPPVGSAAPCLRGRKSRSPLDA